MILKIQFWRFIIRTCFYRQILLKCWHISTSFFLDLMNVADKYHTEEAQCLFNPAAVPVSPISSSYSFCLRPFGWSVPHQAKCVCFEIFPYRLGTEPKPLFPQHITQIIKEISDNLFLLNILQAFIILSCIISVSVNFSTFMVIGKTSPVTYQVLGHLKTCLVLTFGYTLLHDPFTDRNIFGILIAIFGMGLYSYFCTQENKKKQADPLGSQVYLHIHLFPGLYLPIKVC